MRSLFKNVANELIQQLTPEDLKEIMDSTVATVLSQMPPEQRLEFSKEIVNNALANIISGFDNAQRVELIQALLPTLLRETRASELEPEQLADLLRNGGRA